MSSARCRVCGVYAVKRAGQLIIYCLEGCPADQSNISEILDEAERTYPGGAEGLMQFWVNEWSDKRVE